ncbi:MAG: response regulator [Bdellovibrionaceae bacterium]|nr:response regulator [Pseudobdellovibrionaceae bacterium]
MSENASENQKECIVVAEDSPPNRKILVHLLEKLGYEVVSCEDGKIAWEKLESGELKNVVAILSDIMMPNMDGIQLLKNVRAHETFGPLPFILITAVSDREYIIQAKELKVNGYILKPVTFQRVTSKLKEIFPDKKFDKLAS